MAGVMEGALEAQNQAVRNGAKPSIRLHGCRLEPHMARTLFETELQRNAGIDEADMSAQLVLTNALSPVYAGLDSSSIQSVTTRLAKVFQAV